ncbi:MAG TPA: hypothetical protein VHP83_19575, partial [Aggregatilineaceae bacterium]|nr:hypothetical protein [Aggregatilineaceae bacterium]
EFDVPAPPITGQGQTIAWSPNAQMIAYTVPNGVRIAQVSAGEYGSPLFDTIEGGPWVDLRWDAIDTLVLRDQQDGRRSIRLDNGDWMRGEDSGGFTPTDELSSTSLAAEGVRFANGTVVPGTAGALAFNWGPLPADTFANTPKSYALYFLMDDASGTAQIWQLPAQGDSAVGAVALTTETTSITRYALAPGDTQIAFVAGNLLIAANLDGSNRRELATLIGDNGMTGLDWSPDSSQIAYNDQRGLWTVTADASQPSRLILQNTASMAEGQDIGGLRFYSDPRWSPDGTRLLVTVGYYEGAAPGIVDVTSGSITEFPYASGAQGMWTADGRVITWASGFGYQTPGLYLLDPAQPDSPTTLLDEQYPVLDVMQSTSGMWFVLVSSSVSMGPQYVYPLFAETLEGPFTVAWYDIAGLFLDYPQLAPLKEFVAADLPPVWAAGLRNAIYNEQNQLVGDLIVGTATTGWMVNIQTPRPVWNIQWGSRAWDE